MKKTLLLSLLLCAVNFAFAKKVKFAVNMTGLEIDTTGIHVAGDFQALAGFGDDWDPATTKLTKEGNTDIYSIVVDIPAHRKYEFRFFNGDKGYQSEFIPEESRVLYQFNDNRWLYVDSLRNDTTNVGAVLFAGNAPIGKKLLRFQVQLPKTIALDAKKMHIAGNWQGWKPEEITMYSFDGLVHEYIAYVDSLSTTAYKFINGNTAAQYETIVGSCTQNGNRSHVMQDHIILPVVCYAECIACKTSAANNIELLNSISISPNPFNAEFNVNFKGESNFHSVILSNQLGQILVQQIQLIGNQFTFENANLAKGVYFLKVINDKNQTATIKVVKN
jgi:hypothetical protein